MSGRDIAAVMVTVDRSPGVNYLAETLDNLKRSGLLTSRRLETLALVDSGPGCSWAGPIAESFGSRLVSWNWPLEGATRCANLNVAAALKHGAALAYCSWVLFLEDDIDVCADFFDSVGAWLDDHADDRYPFYPLGASYPQVSRALQFGASAWEYPLDKFYGTQAVAFPSPHAAAAAAYILEHANDRVTQVLPDGSLNVAEGHGYDLLLRDYALSLGGVEYLLTPAPSFVQHIGRESSLVPRPSTHTFPSWPGREWRYEGRQAA